MAIELPQDLPFRTPPDIASRQQVRFSFDRIGQRVNKIWDALQLLNEADYVISEGNGIAIDEDRNLTLDIGLGLYFDDNALTVGALSPITVASGVVQLLYGQGLEVVSEQLKVKLGDYLEFATDSITVDFSDATTTTTLTSRYLIMTDTSGNLYKVLAPNIWYLSYGSPAGLSVSTAAYSPLPFDNYTTPSGSVSQATWNSTHHAQINAIFLQIIGFVEDIQDDLNTAISLLQSKGL